MRAPATNVLPVNAPKALPTRKGRKPRPSEVRRAAATPKRINVRTGIRSVHLLRDSFDARTRIGKSYRAQRAAYAAHLGGDLSLPQEKLMDQTIRLSLLSDLAWSALLEAGQVVQDGTLHPALDAFMRTSRDLREALKLIGLKRHARPVRSLPDILRGGSC